MINCGRFILAGIAFVASVVFSFVISYWLLILAGIACVYVAAQWFVIRCRVYELTTERIRIRTGIVNRRTDEMELYRVQDITLLEPLGERLFGLGTIHITTSDDSTPNLWIEAIRGASDLREELRKSVEACRDQKRVRVTEVE